MNRSEISRLSRKSSLNYYFLLAVVTSWGLSLSVQLRDMSEALTYALNARQVVVVPHHATMGDEAPTPVSGP